MVQLAWPVPEAWEASQCCSPPIRTPFKKAKEDPPKNRVMLITSCGTGNKPEREHRQLVAAAVRSGRLLGRQTPILSCHQGNQFSTCKAQSLWKCSPEKWVNLTWFRNQAWRCTLPSKDSGSRGKRVKHSKSVCHTMKETPIPKQVRTSKTLTNSP